MNLKETKKEFVIEEYKLLREDILAAIERTHTTNIYFLIGIAFAEAYIIKTDIVLVLVMSLLLYIGWFAYMSIQIIDIQIRSNYIRRLEKKLNSLIGEKLFIWENFIIEQRETDFSKIFKISKYWSLYFIGFAVPFLFFIAHSIYTIKVIYDSFSNNNLDKSSVIFYFIIIVLLILIMFSSVFLLKSIAANVGKKGEKI